MCKDVVVDPKLLSLTGEILPKGANTKNYAKLDVSCRGFWAPLNKTFLDIRVLNPNAMSNTNKSIENMYKSHENQKKTSYYPTTIG